MSFIKELLRKHYPALEDYIHIDKVAGVVEKALGEETQPHDGERLRLLATMMANSSPESHNALNDLLGEMRSASFRPADLWPQDLRRAVDAVPAYREGMAFVVRTPEGVRPRTRKFVATIRKFVTYQVPIEATDMAAAADHANLIVRDANDAIGADRGSTEFIMAGVTPGGTK